MEMPSKMAESLGLREVMNDTDLLTTEVAPTHPQMEVIAMNHEIEDILPPVLTPQVDLSEIPLEQMVMPRSIQITQSLSLTNANDLRLPFLEDMNMDQFEAMLKSTKEKEITEEPKKVIILRDCSNFTIQM